MKSSALKGKTFSDRINDLLDKHFNTLILIGCVVAYLKYKKYSDAKKDAAFEETLMTGKSGEVAELEKKGTLSQVKTKTGTVTSSSWGTETKEQAAANKKMVEIGLDAEAAKLATRLRSALNPSGFSWSIGMDGTNEAEINKAFADMKRFQLEYTRVAKQYEGLYKSNLRKDLESELSSAEFLKLVI